MFIVEDNIQEIKRVRWEEYAIKEYVRDLREEQKINPSPFILRAKIHDLVCELYVDGYPCLEIADILSLGSNTPYRILKRKGIYKIPEPIIAKEVEDEVVNMYVNGIKVKEIVKQMNICKTSVNRIITRNNTPRRCKVIRRKREKPEDHILKKSIEMYQEGFTVNDIMSATGLLSSHYLYYALRKSGIHMREGCRGKTQKKDAMIEQAIHLYQNGNLTILEITKKTGIPLSTFRKLLIKREIPFRLPAGASEEEKEEAVRLYQEGWKLDYIRQKTNVHSATLGKLLKDRGIPLRKKKE